MARSRVLLATAAIVLLAGPAARGGAEGAYQDPIDSKAYTPPGGWKRYLPEHPTPEAPEKVSLGEVRLLSPQEAIATSTSVDDLVAFIRAATAIAQDAFAPSTRSSMLLLQFDCDPRSQRLRMASQGAPEPELMQKLYDAASTMKPLPMRSGSFAFQVTFKVAGPGAAGPAAATTQAGPRPDSGDAAVTAPDGFVLQRLDGTDGLIARPKDWHYMSHPDPAGRTWIIAAEDPTAGSYETGLRIQMLVGVQKSTGQTAQAFAQQYLAGKQKSSKVLSTCPPTPMGAFMRQCLETLEDITLGGTTKTYHVAYSVFWGTTMDIVTVTTFGTPAERWNEDKPIAAVMEKFELIGPNFGKDHAPSAGAGVP